MNTDSVKELKDCFAECMISMVSHMEKQQAMYENLLEQCNVLLKGADNRLDRANEIVLSLSESTKAMSKAIDTNSEIVSHLENTYTSRIDQAVENKNQMREAYIKLLAKYEELDSDFKSTLKEMARRPTITNTTGNG